MRGRSFAQREKIDQAREAHNRASLPSLGVQPTVTVVRIQGVDQALEQMHPGRKPGDLKGRSLLDERSVHQPRYGATPALV